MATERLRKYEYAALPPRFIRILELQPEPSETAELKCRLVAQKIEDETYAALSYVWGKPTVYHSSILCTDAANDAHEGYIEIGANLTRALVAYRLHDQPRRVWVDAICINQHNSTERHAQVRMMGDIFRGAEQVLCWLGGFNNPELDEPASLIAIAFLRQFNRDQKGELRKIQRYLRHDIESEDDPLVHMSWLAMKIFFDIPYFHRAWIIQEVGLARQAKLSWGKSEICIEWDEIARFSRFMDDEGASIVTHFDLKSWVCNHINLVWTLKADGSPLYDFSEVLHWARIHISTDPRDYVYALLGHPSAQINGDLIIEPRYTIPTAEVYTNLATNTIAKTQSLHILAFVDHGENFGTTNIPTWVPDWHALNVVAPLRYPTQAAPKVIGTDIFVPEGNLLRCQGFLIDDIIAISDMVTPKELPITTYEAEVKKAIPFLVDHFYERLVRDSGIPPSSWQQFVFALGSVLSGATYKSEDATQGSVRAQQRADCAAYISKFGQFKSESYPLSFLDSLTAEERTSLEQLAADGSAAQFIQDITWTSMCRKVFRTRNGYFGLGPRIMKKDDICAVVLGSIYPLILRRYDHSYRLVGPALIYGFMDHEALVAGIEKQDLTIH